VRLTATLAVLAVSASTAWAQAPGRPISRLEAISARDLSGNPVKVSLAGKVTAVLFISAQCPVSNAYNERMESLYKDYAARGVQFVFLNANVNEGAEQIDKHARDVGFTFRVLRDENSATADALGAQFTPETYVIDPQGIIRYHGRIDDSRPGDHITAQNLRLALDEVLTGKPVAVPEAKAFGCTIKRGKKST
jgi:hypothetical protein